MDKQYRDMNAEERLAWGIDESRQRQQELTAVNSAEALKEAQDNAKHRRNAIGASLAAASRMVIEANRHLRRNG